MSDLRFAFRSLLKAPGFTAVAVLTFALGIGASTAVFTVADSVLLRPLAYHESGRLVAAWEHLRFLGDLPVGPNPRHVEVWQQRATAFSEFALLRQAPVGVALDADDPRLTGRVFCLPNLFGLLRVNPQLGRDFRPEDSASGNVAILTHALWQSLFRGDPGAIGKTIRVDNVPFEVIGVLPDGFHFPNANALRAFSAGPPRNDLPEPALFTPVALDQISQEWSGNYGNFVALGRLTPDTNLAAAAAQINAIQAQLQQEHPGELGEPGALRASVQPMREAVAGEVGTGLWLLLAAVSGLLLIACLNLANAQVGRHLAKRRDAAVRAALGATSWQLIRSSLAETLLMATAGGALGVFCAAASLALFRRHAPIDLPRLAEIHLDSGVLLFSAGITLAACLVSGLLPAWQLRSLNPQTALQQGGTRSLGSRQGRRLRAWLIGLQVFGCTALLLVTGLFGKSLLRLFHQDRGFETAHVAVAEIQLPRSLYAEDQSRVALIDRILRALRETPGVEAAGFVSAMPLEGESWIEPAKRVDQPDQPTPMVNARWVSPGYFESTRQRLVRGRDFEERDRDLDSVILSEGEAKALWGDADPIGGQVTVLGRKSTVIGVVADSRNTSLKAEPVKMVYVHYGYRTPGRIFFLARSTHDAAALIAPLRETIRQQAPNATIARVKTLDSQLADSLARERFQTFVLMAFGAAALLLAMLGIYGVLSHAVAARRQEIGVRMALGASRGNIYGLVMAQAGGPVLAGLVSGLLASLLAGRAVESFLFGTEVADPAVVAAVIGLFLAAAASAAFLPARRATRVDPMIALRAE